ncbi:MAG: Gldg family protein [Planctomycetota bacterium]
MTTMLNPHGIAAVFRRQLHSYLGNPLGYIFILFFVCLSAGLLFFPDQYAKLGVTNFGLLYSVMPILLMVFVPTIAMPAWSVEREQGTEELMLTMPVSVLDAVLGKFFAVAGFFTVAMAFNLTHLFFLAYLGDPDWGLIAVNLFGWWMAGIAFAALGLLASAMVAHQAIAFVLGVLLCAVVGFGFEWATNGWFRGLNNGLVGIGSVFSALGVTIAGLALTWLVINARTTWHAQAQGKAVMAVVNVALGLALCVNLALIGQRYHLNADLTMEGVSSLHPASAEVLDELDAPVVLTVVISQNLPEQLQVRKQEILDMALAIERAGGDEVVVRYKFPENDVGPIADEAREQYGLITRQVASESIARTTNVHVFLGAVAVAGPYMQTIPFFDRGLPIEFEMVRAIRTVARRQQAALAAPAAPADDGETADDAADGDETVAGDTDLGLPVLGIVSTGFKLEGGYDFTGGSFQEDPRWAMVQEWERQYEVRAVALREPVSSDIDVLVAAGPSDLTPDQIGHLYDYIWAGRPCMLMVDPFPLVDPSMAPSEPREQPPQNNQMQRQPPPEPKVELAPLMRALKVDFDTDRLGWTEFPMPSPIEGQMQGWLRPLVGWLRPDGGGILSEGKGADLTEALESVVILAGGVFYEGRTGDSQTTITPLLRLPAEVGHGSKALDEIFVKMPTWRGGGRMPRPNVRYLPEDEARTPLQAAWIAGRMAYPQLPETPPTPSEDDAQPERPEAGALSENEINVILIADVDIAGDQFYYAYANAAGTGAANESAEAREVRAILSSIGNVAFLSNVIDALAGDRKLLEVRSRRDKYRSHLAIDTIKEANAAKMSELREELERKADAEIQSVRESFSQSVSQIKGEDTDALSQTQALFSTQQRLQRDLQAKIERIEKKSERKMREAAAELDQEVVAHWWWIRWLSVLVPAVLILGLSIVVLSVRKMNERVDIPAARRRS